MSIALKPKEETNKYISPIFNLNNFYKVMITHQKPIFYHMQIYTLLIFFNILTPLQMV
jgi:hypothetical protein